ncbi:MAG: hypothetical protein V3S51_00745, partial [Dehalococcoidia bacterium]
ISDCSVPFLSGSWCRNAFYYGMIAEECAPCKGLRQDPTVATDEPAQVVSWPGLGKGDPRRSFSIVLPSRGAGRPAGCLAA